YGKDNNCYGTVDEGAACPADAGWYARTDSVPSHDFQAVASTDAGSSIAAGLAGTMVVLQPSTTPTFVNHTADCGVHDWTAGWFDPVTDQIFLAGTNGDCEIHGRTATSCLQGLSGYFNTSRGNTRGLVGFHGGTIESTGLDIFAVMESGQTLVWDGTLVGDDHSLGTVSG